jgi:hypothetical protein
VPGWILFLAVLLAICISGHCLIAHKDYTAAGFKLLPSGEGQTKYSILQAVILFITAFTGRHLAVF